MLTPCAPIGMHMNRDVIMSVLVSDDGVQLSSFVSQEMCKGLTNLEAC